MIFLIILFIILGLFIILSLLLALPIKLNVNTESEIPFSISYLCFTFYPRKKKSKKTKIKEKPKTESKKTTKSKKNKKSLSYYISKYKEPIITLLNSLGKLVKKIKVKHITLFAVIGSDDAAKTAIEYGVVSSGVYMLLSVIDNILDVKSKKVSLSPDFENGKNDIKFSTELRFHPLYSIPTLIKVAMAIVKIVNKQ